MSDSKHHSKHKKESADNTVEDLICVGVVLGPHGIQGELKLKSYTQDPKQIGAYGPLILKGCEDVLTILKLRSPRDNVFVASVKEVGDRTTADLLKGQELFVSKSKLKDIEDPDDFYFQDLVGLKVQDTNEKEIGLLQAVFDFGAGTILEIKLSSGKENIMIPFLREWIIEVNLDSGFLVIDAAYLAEYLKPFKQSDETWEEKK